MQKIDAQNHIFCMKLFRNNRNHQLVTGAKFARSSQITAICEKCCLSIIYPTSLKFYRTPINWWNYHIYWYVCGPPSNKERVLLKKFSGGVAPLYFIFPIHKSWFCHVKKYTIVVFLSIQYWTLLIWKCVLLYEGLSDTAKEQKSYST